MFVQSKTPDPKPPKGYVMISQDLNEAFLKHELKRVRNKEKIPRFGPKEETPTDLQWFETSCGLKYNDFEL